MSSVGERGEETLVMTSLSTADRSRVILKQEYPDYINATYVNVSTGNYLKVNSDCHGYNCSIVRDTRNRKPSS